MLLRQPMGFQLWHDASYRSAHLLPLMTVVILAERVPNPPAGVFFSRTSASIRPLPADVATVQR